MSEAPSPTVPPVEITPAPVSVQLSLPGAQEMFAAVGLETLPHGASEMNPKQLRFAIEFLRCGNATMAASRAGYSPDNAEKLRKTTVVMRFLNAATKTVAQNADLLVERNARLSASLHDELTFLRGIDAKKKTAKQEKREDRIVKLVGRVDMLLLAALNRLGIKLTGEVNVNHTATGGADFIVVPPDALPGFAAARAEVAATNRLVAASKHGEN